MGGILALLLLIAVVVVVAGAAGAYLLASKSRKSYLEANQVIPGRPSRAPASWAGSHDPEAVLHRRLRDAMAALRANQAFDDDGGLLDVRVELEEQALAIDDELVAVAALPRLHRHEPLAKVTEAVNTIETAVAELASRSVVEAGPRLDEVLRRIRDRTSLIDEIRGELDRLPDASGQSSPPAPQAPASLPPAQTAPPSPSSPPPSAQPSPAPDADGEPGQPGTPAPG